VAEGIDKEKRVGLDLPQVAKGDPPSSLDTLIKVEQSLTMPRQEDETSSMEGPSTEGHRNIEEPPSDDRRDVTIIIQQDVDYVICHMITNAYDA